MVKTNASKQIKNQLVPFNKIFQINSLPKPDSAIIDDDMSISDMAEREGRGEGREEDEESSTIFNEVERPRHKHHDSSLSSTRIVQRNNTNSTIQQASFNKTRVNDGDI